MPNQRKPSSSLNGELANIDWNFARAFLVTVERGSLSSAAKELGLSQPTLSRQISAFEQQLSVVLFERVGRNLIATPAAMTLVEHVRTMADAARALGLAASGKVSVIDGKISIACTEVAAYFQLPKIVKELRETYPGIEVSIISSNDASDLKRREADIAIRAFRPHEADLITRLIGEFTATLYGSHQYLDALGKPTKKSQFNRADFIGYPKDNERYMSVLNDEGFNLTEKNFPIRCNNHLAHWELCKQGVGLGVMPTHVGDAEPAVKRALSDEDSIYTSQLWLVAHRELRTNLRVRAVFDFLHGRLAAQLTK